MIIPGRDLRCSEDAKQVIGVQSRITIVDERQDFPFQYKEGAHTWFSDAQDYCKDIDFMAVHPCKRDELLGVCES